VFVKDEPGALVFPGAMGGPLRRGNLNKMSAWPHAVESIGMAGPHFHVLRHTSNHFAERRRASGPDGPHRSRQRTGPMIYQHEAQGADKTITDAIDTHVQYQKHKDDDQDGRAAGVLAPRANGTGGREGPATFKA
jgi:hypothetical protein